MQLLVQKKCRESPVSTLHYHPTSTRSRASLLRMLVVLIVLCPSLRQDGTEELRPGRVDGGPSRHRRRRRGSRHGGRVVHRARAAVASHDDSGGAARHVHVVPVPRDGSGPAHAASAHQAAAATAASPQAQSVPREVGVPLLGPAPEQGVDQLGVERHVDPGVQAGVEGEQPEQKLHVVH